MGGDNAEWNRTKKLQNPIIKVKHSHFDSRKFSILKNGFVCSILALDVILNAEKEKIPKYKREK